MRLKKTYGYLVTAVLAASMAASGAEYSVYQRDIVDRQPFGAPPPPPPKPTAPPKPPPPPSPILRQLVLVAITDDAEAGIKVGVVNKRTKKPYYMKVGDPPQDGISVVAAYPDEEKVIVMHSGQQETLTLPGAAAKASFTTPAAGAGSEKPTTGPKTTASANDGSSRIVSYRDRLRKRREEMLAARKESGGANEEEMKEKFRKYLEEYQMQAIRSKGKKGKPLPIPLTKEMDDKLVEEGVLPAQE